MTAAPARSTLPLTAVALAAAVVAAHLEAAIQALPVSLPLGLFLLGVAATVAGWATWSWRRAAGPPWVGVPVFAGLAALWLLSRTVGLPFAGGLRAPVGPLDAATALNELLLVAVCIWWAAGRDGGTRMAGAGYLALCASVTMISMGCTVGVASGADRAWAAVHGTPLFCHLI